jgi:hypothetical protein
MRCWGAGWITALEYNENGFRRDGAVIVIQLQWRLTTEGRIGNRYGSIPARNERQIWLAVASRIQPDKRASHPLVQFRVAQADQPD